MKQWEIDREMRRIKKKAHKGLGKEGEHRKTKAKLVSADLKKLEKEKENA